MRDEPLAIRREAGRERGNDRCQHAAYTRALNHDSTVLIPKHQRVSPFSSLILLNS